MFKKQSHFINVGILLILIFTVLNLHADVVEYAEREWVRYYYGLSTGGNDPATNHIVDDSGNIYVIGSTQSDIGDYNFVTIKYDKHGNEDWINHYDGPTSNSDKAYSIMSDSSNNIYVGGYSEGGYTIVKYDTLGNQIGDITHFNGIDITGVKMWVDSAGAIYLAGTSGGDYFAVKYNSTGEQEWLANYGSTEGFYDKAADMSVDNLGNVIITGTSNNDYFTVKFDSNGNFAWFHRYNGLDTVGYSYNAPDIAYHIEIDETGFIYITGQSEAPNGSWATIKFDTEGNIIWHSRPNTGGGYPPYGMTVDASHNVYIVGASAQTIKINNTGQEVWFNQSNQLYLGNGPNDQIISDDCGNIYIAGFSDIGKTSVKYNTDGNVLWKHIPFADGGSIPNTLSLHTSGALYASGYLAAGWGDARDFVTAKYNQYKQYSQLTTGGVNTEIIFENGISLTFSDCISGTATMIESSTGPEIPSDFYTVPEYSSKYFDISYSSQYTGPITIQMPYNEAILNGIDESSLQILHYENSNPIDITTYVDVDQNIIFGETETLSPFITVAPIPLNKIIVNIDIKPGNDQNTVNLDANGVIPVAILSSEDFDVVNIDPLSIVLEGAQVKLKGKSGNAGTLTDINQDGLKDLLVHIYNELDLSEGDSEATLSGVTLDGIPIEGKDHINIVPPIIAKSLSDEDFISNSTPSEFNLFQNFPNPFNPSTKIYYALKEDVNVEISIFNIKGEKITTLHNNFQTKGFYSLSWNGKNRVNNPVSGGIYLCQISAGNFTKTIRMLLLK